MDNSEGNRKETGVRPRFFYLAQLRYFLFPYEFQYFCFRWFFSHTYINRYFLAVFFKPPTFDKGQFLALFHADHLTRVHEKSLF